jgi:RimJ/RimL family protein N-acetyltransferase
MFEPGDRLHTERLMARRFTRDDTETLCRLYADPAVMRHAGGIMTRETALASMQARIFDYYAPNPGLGQWATIERASGECVGLHLLASVRGEFHIQVGFLLFPQFWSKGYATEMARAVLEHGFSTLRLPRIVAITDLDNRASQHVLAKLGMRRNGERRFAAYGPAPLAWFELDSPSSRAQAADSAGQPAPAASGSIGDADAPA